MEANMTEEVIGILDADSIAYKAAAANEVKSIKTAFTKDGEVVIEEWKNRTEFKKYLAGTDHAIEMYTITDHAEPKHLSYAQSTVSSMIQKAQNEMRANSTEIYISGENNFRDFILLPQAYVQQNATFSTIGGKYKSNRDGTARPQLLGALRQWMIDELGAIVVNDMEVDDMSSIRAYDGAKNGQKIIQYTSDKDAGQCHGWLHNPDKDKTPRFITGLGSIYKDEKGKVRGSGRMFLYYQILAGDKVDGYRPVDILDIKTQKAGGGKVQYGDIAALNTLSGCTTDKECWQAIYTQYLKWYPAKLRYTACNDIDYDADALSIMQMYVDCAFMKRWADDRIVVQNVLTKLGIL
jgi:hypothetical protein